MMMATLVLGWFPIISLELPVPMRPSMVSAHAGIVTKLPSEHPRPSQISQMTSFARTDLCSTIKSTQLPIL